MEDFGGCSPTRLGRVDAPETVPVGSSVLSTLSELID